MNLLPILKCKFQEQRNRLSFNVLILVVVVAAVISVGRWDASHASSNVTIPVVCVFLWGLVQFRVFEQYIGKDEYWYSLPFSKTQIFMANLLVQQAVALLALLCFFGLLFIGKAFSWDWRIASTLVNTVTFGAFLVIVLYCFWKPRSIAIKGVWHALLLLAVFLSAVFLSPLAFWFSDFGWWPTYFALPGIGVALVALKRSLHSVEPMTWKRPLRERNVSPPPVKAGDVAASESILDTVLRKCFSPVTRYIARGVWLDWKYGYFFFFSVFMMYTSLAAGQNMAIILLLVCILGGNSIRGSSGPMRALSALPLGFLRLYFMTCVPYFVAMAILLVLSGCFDFGEGNKENFYVNLFVRSSLFFYFLLGVRLVAYPGRRLRDMTTKHARHQEVRKSRPSDPPIRKEEKGWRCWLEQGIVWLGVGVLTIALLKDIPKIGDYLAFDFRAFLLDHYLVCWGVLVVATLIFFRLSLQTFRRVY